MRPILTSWLYRIGKERKQSTSVTLMGFKIEIDKQSKAEQQVQVGNRPFTNFHSDVVCTRLAN